MYKRSLQPLRCRTRQHILEAVWKSCFARLGGLQAALRAASTTALRGSPRSTNRMANESTLHTLSLRSYPNNYQKCIKTNPRMEPKWSQKASLDPLLTQVASLSLPGSIFEAKWVPSGSHFWHHLSNFGVPSFVLFSGTPNSDILASKGYRNRLILGVVFWTFSSKAESRFLNTLT